MNLPAMEENSQFASENCLSLGTRLAEFEITGIIGEGGFGIVYLAFDHSLQRTVALKEYMPGALAGRGEDKSVSVRSSRHQATFNTGLKSFINEARLLAQFDHPALIKVYRFWEENKTGYMAMRYYEGRTVKSLLKHHPEFFTEASLRAILKPMLEALDVLYKDNILHRDISPDNIMIQKNGAAVLLDFGSARQILSGMSQALTVILKPGYAPVEQYADDTSMTQGPWTDIYSLSAVIYAAIVKKAPPTSVARMIKDPVEPLRGGAYPEYSDQFLAAIEKGMAIKPEDRPQTIDDFRKWLGIPVPHGHHGSELPSVAAPVKPESKVAGDVKRPAPVTPIKPNKPKSKTAASGTKAATKGNAAVSKPASRANHPAVLIIGLFLVTGAGVYLALRGYTSSRHAVAAPVVAKLVPIPVAQVADDETLAWEALKAKPDVTPEVFEGFLQMYPSGKHAELARAALVDAKSREVADATASRLVSTAVNKLSQDAVAKPSGAITLALKPWGNVIVNGVTKGVSPPLKKLFLPEGKYQIRVTNPNFPDHVVNLEVGKKTPLTIEYDFSQAKK